jgi:DUF1680 family protein
VVRCALYDVKMGHRMMAPLELGGATAATSDGTSLQTCKRIGTAIPYYTWANRSNHEMQVWLPIRNR